MAAPDWEALERRSGFEGVRTAYERDLRPVLEAMPANTGQKNGIPDNLALPVGLGIAAFFIINMMIETITPDNFLGAVIHIPLFFVGFLACVAGIFHLFQDRFVAILLHGRQRFLARAKVLSTFAKRAGLTYIPAPGGAPPSLRAFAKWKGAPREIRDAADMLDSHGGMQDALSAARDAGVMEAPAILIGGTQEQRNLYANQATSARLEDGFLGTVNDIDVAAFEWVESVEKAPDIYHLVIVLTAPLRLNGVTQLRTRSTDWPRNVSRAGLDRVDLGPEAFSDRFRLRSTDQTEARAIFNPAVIERVIRLAHGDKVQASASGSHLVIDVEGANRFDCVNLITGEWSDESMRTALHDLYEMLDLLREAAHAFMVKR